jgi:YD repeat-containing protein
MLGDGVYTYAYDNEGNLTSKTNVSTGENWTFGYDNIDHLTSVIDKSSTGTLLMQATYVYDPFGQRIEKDVWTSSTGTVVTRFGYDQGNVVSVRRIAFLARRLESGHGFINWRTQPWHEDGGGAIQPKNGFGGERSRSGRGAGNRFAHFVLTNSSASLIFMPGGESSLGGIRRFPENEPGRQTRASTGARESGSVGVANVRHLKRAVSFRSKSWPVSIGWWDGSRLSVPRVGWCASSPVSIGWPSGTC